MSRKHFIAIAEILNDNQKKMTRKAHLNLVCDFTTMLNAQNDNFDRERFWVACGIGNTNPFTQLNNLTQR